MKKRALCLGVLALATLSACGEATVDSDSNTATGVATASSASSSTASSSADTSGASETATSGRTTSTVTVTSTTAGATTAARAVGGAAGPQDQPASAVSSIPQQVPQYTAGEQAYLKQLKTSGVNIDGVEDQLTVTGASVCRNDTITRDAVAGQLVEQRRTDMTPDALSQLLSDAARANLC